MTAEEIECGPGLQERANTRQYDLQCEGEKNCREAKGGDIQDPLPALPRVLYWRDVQALGHKEGRTPGLCPEGRGRQEWCSQPCYQHAAQARLAEFVCRGQGKQDIYTKGGGWSLP